MQNHRMKLVFTDGITVAELFSQFQVFNKAKNLSPATLEYYQRCYIQLIMFAGENLQASDFNEQFVINYISYLQDKQISDNSINAFLRGLRALVNFAIERGHTQRFTVRLIRADKLTKPVYSEEELKLLLRKPDMKNTSFTEYRNWTIVNFLIGTGARTSTICNVRVQDLDLSTGEITLRHMKARRQLIIPLSSNLREVLCEYLAYRQGADDAYLFCNAYGEQLTPNGLKLAIRKYNLRRGVSSTSVHQFRHSFAKLAILAGMDAFRLQHMLGHSDISMTMEYVHLFGRDLAKDYDRYCPLDNLNSKREHIRL